MELPLKFEVDCESRFVWRARKPILIACLPWAMVTKLRNSYPMLSVKLETNGEPPLLKELATSIPGVAGLPEAVWLLLLRRNWKLVSSTAFVPRMDVSVI